MKSPKLTILVGPSCSGKTTLAKEMMNEDSKTFIVSRDTERELLFGKHQTGSPKQENMISDILNLKIAKLLQNKYNVIIDNTNLNIEYINHFINGFNYVADIEIKIMSPIDKVELIKRNQKRYLTTGKLIPEQALHNQLKDLDKLLPKLTQLEYPRQRAKSNFNELSTTLRNVYIVDIDGTLSCSVHRHIFDCEPSEILDDRVIIPVQKIVDTNDCIFLSGRSDKYFDITKQWLEEKVGVKDAVLHMRKEGDYRPDTIIKKELYNTHVKNKYNVLGVIDDRSSVVSQWQKIGLFTFDVSQGKGYF